MHGAEAAQDDVQQVGVLAKRLASKGKGKELLELIRGIRTAGIAVAEALPLQAVVTQLCRHGSTEQVLEVVEALSVDEGLEPWATAMRVYCSWGWTRSAERLMLALEAHGRLEPSEAMLCDLMQAYRQQLGSSKCMKYFRRIEQMQTPSMALCNGLLEAHSGSLEEAMPVFEHLSKQQCFRPNTASFNLLLKAAARTAHEGAAEAALEVVEGMKEVDVRPNKDTFVRLSLVLSRWKRREDVLRLPLQIQEAGLAVEEDLWAALMIAHGRCEALEAAWVLWMDLRHRLPTRPRERTYQSLMNACCEAFQGHRCLPLLQELEGLEGGASEHSYNIAIKGCMPSPGTKASEEQLARAVQLKDRMLAAGRRPSVVTWTSLLDLCASCGQGATALVLYREMLAQDDRVVPDCGMYTCLIKALGSAGMLQEALDVYDEMLQPSVAAPPPQPQRRLRQQAAKPVLRSKPTYITMIRACRLHGDLESALRVYNDMRLQGFAPSNHELNALLQDCAEVQLQAQGSGADAPPSDALANMSQLAGRPPAQLPGLLRAGVAGPLRLVASAAGRGEGSRAAASGEGAADACAGRERMADIVAPLQPTLLGQFDKEAEKVDLHDLSAVEARAAVLYVLRSLYHRVLEGGGRPRKDLVIITGAGRHSLDCRPRIREAIQRLFQELQISLQQAGERVPEPSSPPASGSRGRGTQALQLQRQPEVQQNPGRLVVTSRELNRWIDSRMK